MRVEINIKTTIIKDDTTIIRCVNQFNFDNIMIYLEKVLNIKL